MTGSSPEFPRRLAEGEGKASTLIARALAEHVLGPSEEQSWRKLRTDSARSAPRFTLPAVACALSVVALVVWLSRSSSPEQLVAPDVWLQRPAASSAALVSPSQAEQALTPPARAERPKSSPRALPTGDTGPCAQLAKTGQYQAAAACYGGVAGGSSMAAELALYEKARLEAKALGQSSQALATLDEHAQRFPGGVLATEVELTRIELLSQLGEREQALGAIEKGLSGTLGRERGGDLQVLRAELLGAQGDCAAALDAVHLARQAGAHPSRLETVERRCPAPAPEAP